MTRAVSLLLGAAVAGAGIVALQWPLRSQPARAMLNARILAPVTGPAPALAWPAQGSAALYIPSLGVRESSHGEVVPIASLTKMMTAYVTLARLPLSLGQSGPCVTISPSDVVDYELVRSLDGSNAPVVVGESLCESDLLAGLLVRSANNYATLLATLVAGSPTRFVAMMNAAAAALGLVSTHYVDESGYLPGSVSTAADQARLGAILMRSPVVRSIVDQSSVTLPVAGAVASYTPFVGVDHVIGVKSGRTSAAGGCDVMAMTFTQGTRTRTLYAVVLGQRGGDLLTPAGDAARALAESAIARLRHVALARGAVVASLGWGSRASVETASALDLWWWPGREPRVSWRWDRETSRVRAGQVVGWLRAGTSRVALVAARAVAPPSLWQRLR